MDNFAFLNCRNNPFERQAAPTVTVFSWLVNEYHFVLLGSVSDMCLEFLCRNQRQLIEDHTVGFEWRLYHLVEFIIYN